MFRFLKLIIFLAAVVWSMKYHHDHKSSAVTQGRNLSDGEYSSRSAQASPHLIVYGIPCVQTRKYTGMLDQNDIPYLYKDINQVIKSPAYRTDILPRMTAGHLSPQDLKGPLVDINGRFYMMPDIRTIREQLARS